MEQTKHTPGPWKVRLGLNEAFIDAPGIVCLAVVNSLTDTAEAEVNARLIAAAPELLAACKMVVRLVDDPRSPAAKDPWGDGLTQLEAAIAKAEGRAS